jgi:hypothetical protein
VKWRFKVLQKVLQSATQGATFFSARNLFHRKQRGLILVFRRFRLTAARFRWLAEMRSLLGMSRFPRRKFKRHFPHVIHDQEGRERFSGFGNEFVQQIRAPISEKFCRLGAIDWLLQNLFVNLEFARALVGL